MADKKSDLRVVRTRNALRAAFELQNTYTYQVFED